MVHQKYKSIYRFVGKLLDFNELKILVLPQNNYKKHINGTYLPPKNTIMTLLTQIWSEKTSDFTTAQKAIIGLTTAFIFATSFIASRISNSDKF